MPKLGMNCVSVGEYAEFLNALPEPDKAHHTPQDWEIQLRATAWPVRWVSAADADRYCGFRGVRLPTSREWTEEIARIVPSGLLEWTMESVGSNRILRGASWDSLQFTAHLDSHYHYLPSSFRSNIIGFRVVI